MTNIISDYNTDLYRNAKHRDLAMHYVEISC